MHYHWMTSTAFRPHIERCEAGGFRMTSRPMLPNFEFFAETAEELEADWDDAIAVYLRAIELGADMGSPAQPLGSVATPATVSSSLLVSFGKIPTSQWIPRLLDVARESQSQTLAHA